MSAPCGARWRPPPDSHEVASTLSRRFEQRFGEPPSGVWAAPGRVNLIGEHTDYNQGLCLPMALPHRTYAAVRVRADRANRVASLQQDDGWEGTLDDVGPGSPRGWAAYAAGVLWALGQRGLDLPGLDVLVDGHVPLGSGLSSSAALECSVAAAVAGLVDEVGSLAPEELVEACVAAENVVAGASTGGLDQSTALRARAGHVMLLDCRDFSVEQVPWMLDGWTLLVVDTRAPHALVDGQYAQRRRSCEEAAARLGVTSLRDVEAAELESALARLAGDEVLVRRTRHVVTEIERVRRAAHSLRGGDVAALGQLMAASHVSLRDDYEVSCPELDTVVDTALHAGAAGARMTGGGFGGSAVALVRRDESAAVADAVAAAFADRGWGAPQVLEAVPSGPATRVQPRS